MGAAAIPIFMVASAAVAAEQASRANQAARDTRASAEFTNKKRSEFLKNRQAVLASAIAKKSDQQRLQVARQVTLERGARIARSAAKGTNAYSGSEGVGLMDLDMRRDTLQATIASNFGTDMKTLQSQTESGIIDNDAALRQTIAQANSMQQNPFLATFAGGLGGLGSGLQVYGATKP